MSALHSIDPRFFFFLIEFIKHVMLLVKVQWVVLLQHWCYTCSIVSQIWLLPRNALSTTVSLVSCLPLLKVRIVILFSKSHLKFLSSYSFVEWGKFGLNWVSYVFIVTTSCHVSVSNGWLVLWNHFYYLVSWYCWCVIGFYFIVLIEKWKIKRCHFLMLWSLESRLISADFMELELDKSVHYMLTLWCAQWINLWTSVFFSSILFLFEQLIALVNELVRCLRIFNLQDLLLVIWVILVVWEAIGWWQVTADIGCIFILSLLDSWDLVSECIVHLFYWEFLQFLLLSLLLLFLVYW